MTAAGLTKVPLIRWSKVDLPEIDTWLWFDTAKPGLHVARTLGSAPAEASHVWGWNAERSVLARLRADRDLGGFDELGVVGATLHLTGGGDESVDVEKAESQIWHPADGRINADPTSPVFTGNRLVTLYTAYREVVMPSGVLAQVPLVFMALESETW
jgi:hypothetical protein